MFGTFNVLFLHIMGHHATTLMLEVLISYFE